MPSSCIVLAAVIVFVAVVAVDIYIVVDYHSGSRASDGSPSGSSTTVGSRCTEELSPRHDGCLPQKALNAEPALDRVSSCCPESNRGVDMGAGVWHWLLNDDSDSEAGAL